MSALNGYKTYIVFGLYLAVAVLAGQGIGQPEGVDSTAAAVSDFLANPLVVALIGAVMRLVTAQTTEATG